MNEFLSFPAGRASRIQASDIWRELRPKQLTKNLIIFVAFVFALGDKHQSIALTGFWTACLAFVLFSVTTSGIYIFNDIRDIVLDRAHPVKSQRPIAAGRMPLPLAWSLMGILLCAGLAGSWLFSIPFGLVVTAYVILQLFYTLWLKHVSLVDVFVIAAGFVLRVIAGGIAVNVTLSPWLLVCTFLMALFLALCKRRHEKRLTAEMRNAESRPSLMSSDERLLDQLIAIIAGAVIVVYAIYTQWPETVMKFQTNRLALTIPFVIFGLFRYLDLVYRQSKGDQPEYILLTDIPLMIAIVLFGLSVLFIIVI
ncbi:MAG: decaprenyl-phosphate phosphoribosyltransferase [Verrucomicrobia bacterium]|nr:decaprenyl-phosphate phosphoribosyltransferase [Verrucomicrobiota bacterium]MBU4291686.1 decaprenyl-phosphate phosphoribosyltransferase [Verrucomicrobiota bacterium]MBU4430310.1 decaprenyl-phosphate phosphoribosyltransferase [Verrucomicrobiota bacterium]MCG2680415.1 decaprenyl-phosphate phosphoribosyltransferase [Kiritimatiellia bacterium]